MGLEQLFLGSQKVKQTKPVNALEIETLVEEKNILQKDFDEMSTKVKTVEVELVQMKANLNALNGAIQQVNKLIRMAQPKKGKK